MNAYTIVSLDREPAPGEPFEIQRVIEAGEDSVDVTPLGTGEVETTLAAAMAAHGFRLGEQIESGAGAYDFALEPTVEVGDLRTGVRLLTTEEVAAALGIARRSLLTYISDRRAERAPQPDVHLSGRPLWLASTIEAWAKR